MLPNANRVDGDDDRQYKVMRCGAWLALAKACVKSQSNFAGILKLGDSLRFADACSPVKVW